MILDKTLSPIKKMDALVAYWNRIDAMPLDIASVEAAVIMQQIKKIQTESAHELSGHAWEIKNYTNLQHVLCLK